MSDTRFSDPLEARKKAMDYLARREHGRAELLHKLEKAGFNPEIASDAVVQLVDDGLQSDQRYVESFVQSRIQQGKGPVRIRAELRERRLSDSAIEQGIANADQDWVALARDVRSRKFGDSRPADFNAKAKQMRFLQYRGFEPDHIRAAVSATRE